MEAGPPCSSRITIRAPLEANLCQAIQPVGPGAPNKSKQVFRSDRGMHLDSFNYLVRTGHCEARSDLNHWCGASVRRGLSTRKAHIPVISAATKRARAVERFTNCAPA